MSISLFSNFWSTAPALLYGMLFLLGFYSSLQGSWFLIFPLLLVGSAFFTTHYFRTRQNLKQLVLSGLVFISAWMYGSSHYHFPILEQGGIKGAAWIEIESLRLKTTYFGKQWVYSCQLNSFLPDNKPSTSIAKNIKCTLTLTPDPTLKRPLANQSYLVQGTLKQAESGAYFLKVKKEEDWLPVAASWSLAEWRYKAKKAVINWIQHHFSHPPSATFLAGLATGEFDDHLMQHEFARFGLQHIMAISGFHFAIIAGILSFLLRLWIPRKVAALSIILFLNGYFLFLGTSPSILRAWLMICVALLGHCLNKQSHALNLLGVALIGVLLIDPLACQTIGFQLSFLVTAAILIGYAPLDYFLSTVLLKRPLSQVIEMNRLNQHAYCLLAFFRQGLALMLTVNVVALPAALYYFHQFPFMSLFYNLFFPLLVSFSMFLLLLGFPLSFIAEPLGQFVHNFNNFYTKWVLNLIYNPPSSIDTYYQIESFSAVWIIIYLCLITLIGMWARFYIKEKLSERQDFVFL
jgi:competence protein ComEC